MTKSWIITLARTVKSLASKENMNFDIFKRSIGMDTRFLEGFVTVVEHGSEAARPLNLAPAAVAQQIRTLEGEMGVRLCLPTGRHERAQAQKSRTAAHDMATQRSVAGSWNVRLMSAGE
jgi:Bacterial regulatory helix-turn-helix protein, lysR family